MKLRLLYLIASLLISCSTVFAQFTPGNIVVCRIGDKLTTVSNAASPVFFDEYTTSGTLVQSIALPTMQNGANRALTLPATRYSGMVTLSADGQYLVVPGFDAPVAYTDVAFTSSATIARVIGLVNYNGTINTTTALTDWSSGGPVISATSTDGTAIWATGQGTSNSTGGLRYTTPGSATSTQVNSTRLSLTGIAIVQGQLYVSQGTLVYKVGTGLPTTSGQALANFGSLPTTGSFRTQFVLLDMDPGIAGVDVLYVADEIRGLSKFSLVNGLWSSNGDVGGDADDYRGLTAQVNGNIVTLFATRAGANDPLFGGGQLVTITDATGYNGAFTGTPAVIATMPLNTASLKGVALAPVQAPLCPSPVLSTTAITPNSAVISWNALNGASGYQDALTSSATPPASGTPISTTSYNATGLTQGQTYYFHVRSSCGTFNYSSWSSISFTPACVAPALTINNTGYEAMVKWNKVVGSTQYEYAVTNSAAPPSAGTATADTSFVVNDLSSITSYYVHVRSNCGTGGFSSWTTKSFTTPCLNPIVTATLHNDTRKFEWRKVKDALNYEYALTTYSVPPFGGTVTQDTVARFSKIDAGVTYYFHVRTKCAADGGVSVWTTVPFQTAGLDVYPNPVTSMLTVKLYGTSTTGEVILTDAMGKVVRRTAMTNSRIDINVQSLAPGIYLVRYSDGQNKYLSKFLKK